MWILSQSNSCKNLNQVQQIIAQLKKIKNPNPEKFQHWDFLILKGI